MFHVDKELDRAVRINCMRQPGLLRTSTSIETSIATRILNQKTSSGKKPDMTTQTVLVIDDSATIRKMVDSHLSQEGYRVVLAANGELGVSMAQEIRPDLILLDHQLPGTTGLEVCRKIIQLPECRFIPFVVSSTLRKQAYVEYMDVPNVVDSLPKPFKPELLKMTVANALETGSMVIASQTNGTAVPEVVGETDQPALSGDFRWLGLREVIDFLNNGRKNGMLEVETARNRICFFLNEGRIQGVVSASFDPSEVAEQLPETLKNLAPLLQFTMSSGTSTRVDGLMELMDKKVLDPRMLRTLLRQQAAVLTRYCFLNNPVNFSFLPERAAPSLFQKAGVDCCLPALLIDSSLNVTTNDELPNDPSATDVGWTRNSLRGQNLDRTGLTASHIQLLSWLDTNPKTSNEIAQRSGLPLKEVVAVLEGLLLADWVENKVMVESRTLIAYETDVAGANLLRTIVEDSHSGWSGNVVRDDFSLQLLLKRKSPDVTLIAVQGEHVLDVPSRLKGSVVSGELGHVVLIVPNNPADVPLAASLQSFPKLQRPFKKHDVLTAISASNTIAKEDVIIGKAVARAVSSPVASSSEPLVSSGAQS